MSRRGWALFLAMAFVWGVPYLLIKVAVEEMSPAMLVLARTALATLILLPLAAARGQLRTLLPHWRPITAFAVVEIAVPWVLLNAAEQRLSSSLTGLLIAAVPLVGAALAWSGLTGSSEDPVDARRMLGLLVGLAGVAALVGFEVGGGDLWAVVGIGVVAVCYASGPVILSRWLSDLPGLGVIAVSLALTAVVYLPIGLATAPTELPSAKALWSVVGLAVVCTALAFLLFFALIAEVGPTRSTVITYLNPAVALLLGVWLLDERFTAATGIGFALILLGSVLATQRNRPRVLAAEEPVITLPASRSSLDSECEVLGGPRPVPEP
jgi:drug/metabolite transporter (DMT)-like permease